MHVLGLLTFTHFVSTAGYSAVFILSLLQSCCVPTSSELTLGFAGVLAAQGRLSLAGVIVAGVVGEVVGAYIAWAVGRHAGRAVVDRFGRYILLTHRDLDRAEAWYDRHQRFGVFGSRLLPVIRNFVAVPAGIAEVPLVRFGVLTGAGSLLWDGAWAGIGYGVGSHWHAIVSGFSYIGYVLALVAAVAIAFAFYHRYYSYRQATAAAEVAGPATAGSTAAYVPGSPIAAWRAAVERGRQAATGVEPLVDEADRGVEANGRLTAMLGALLLVLLAVEGLTLLHIHVLWTLAVHVVVGMVLVPVVLLKIGSTTWRFARYYLGSPAYRRKGPPPAVLRLLGPFVVVSTVAVVASGIVLLLVPPNLRNELLLIHRVTFVLWFAAMVVHVLGHLLDVAQLAPRDFYRRTRSQVRGAGLRQWATVIAVGVGIVLAVAVAPKVGPWFVQYQSAHKKVDGYGSVTAPTRLHPRS